jgi:hypothetical protein
MFDNESFSHVGGSSPAPRIYTYETLDGRTVVLDTLTRRTLSYRLKT